MFAHAYCERQPHHSITPSPHPSISPKPCQEVDPWTDTPWTQTPERTELVEVGDGVHEVGVQVPHDGLRGRRGLGLAAGHHHHLGAEPFQFALGISVAKNCRMERDSKKNNSNENTTSTKPLSEAENDTQ